MKACQLRLLNFRKLQVQVLNFSSSVKAALVHDQLQFIGLYISFLIYNVWSLCGWTERPLEGFHIVVDAGNGAGGFFAVSYSLKLAYRCT